MSTKFEIACKICAAGCSSGVALFDPLQEYIVKHNTRYTDRECWQWSPCTSDEWVVQLPVDDGLGFLVQPQVVFRSHDSAFLLHLWLWLSF